MIQPLELHEMNLLELYEKLRMSDNDFERWMTNLGLLHSSILCYNCQQPMIDRMQGRNRCWICDHQDCLCDFGTVESFMCATLSIPSHVIIYRILRENGVN